MSLTKTCWTLYSFGGEGRFGLKVTGKGGTFKQCCRAATFFRWLRHQLQLRKSLVPEQTPALTKFGRHRLWHRLLTLKFVKFELWKSWLLTFLINWILFIFINCSEFMLNTKTMLLFFPFLKNAAGSALIRRLRLQLSAPTGQRTGIRTGSGYSFGYIRLCNTAF